MSSPDPDAPDALLSASVKLTPAETARYAGDLIESLRKIAEQQGQPILAHLLALAAVEAKSLSRDN